MTDTPHDPAKTEPDATATETGKVGGDAPSGLKEPALQDGTPSPYQVLARKYRPETFADLVGQEAMVRTLKNAFAADRIAQAFILTGIRGTGKTTTARIIAKGLNCIGPDGSGGPTVTPCGVCEPCRAIGEGRHVDVQEMDAASHTGVQNIRDAIIETVSYRASSARYKVFIIDEVHMLSTSAFNALLKTLEEPPAHVKFIFATTEIRKVPVTVLSRCQRFDLRRIEPEDMTALLRRIADGEGARISDGALAMITRAAEGSARDATSLLDQAISHGAGETGADQVRAMLGLADRGRVLDLFEMVLRGEAAAALTELQAQYAEGADPVAVLRDLAEITHWVSVLKITPEAIDDPTLTPDERMRGTGLAERLPMRVLSRMWQMLLKVLEEVSVAPNAMMAAEMAVIRLTHMADLPDPEALIRKIRATQEAGGFAPQGNGRAGGPGNGGAVGRAGGSGAQAGQAGQAPAHGAAAPRASGSSPQAGSHPHGARHGPATTAGAQGAAGMATAQALDPALQPADFPDWESVLALISRMRDIGLLMDVEEHLHLARYAPGRIEFQPGPGAPRDLAQRLAERLRGWTGGARWAVTVVNSGGAPSIAEARRAAAAALRSRVEDSPLMEAVRAAFPQARIASIRPMPPASPEDEDFGLAPGEASAQVDSGEGPVAPAEEWDPFEDDEE